LACVVAVIGIVPRCGTTANKDGNDYDVWLADLRERLNVGPDDPDAKNIANRVHQLSAMCSTRLANVERMITEIHEGLFETSATVTK